MSKYIPKITKRDESSFFALIVRVDSDGEESVINTYNGRYFKSEKAALKSTNNHIAKM